MQTRGRPYGGWRGWAKAIGMAGVLWLAVPNPASAQLGALLSPGRLARPHASLEGIRNCVKCHEQGRQVTARKCLACHATVAQRIAKKAGVHKNVTTDCVSCHAEHAGVDGELRPFDVKAFDHAAVTGFALTGKHATAAGQCSACHKTRSFLGLSPSCASCHADVHRGRLGRNCVTCHSPAVAFKDIEHGFDHSKTAFPLAGAHRALACTSCHRNNVFTGVQFASCADCHRDPHLQRFGPSCSSCHTSQSWRTTRVDHSKTTFPLVGRHATVACIACHKQPATEVKLRADTCASCHADVHKGAFKQDCKACHSESGFEKAPFDHSKTRFMLTGRHAGLACQACHKSVVLAARKTPVTRAVDFRGLSGTCASCHTDVHRAALGAACETCHSTTTFHVTAFTHPRFPEFFGGQHAAVACAKCHVGMLVPDRQAGTPVALNVTFKNLSTACATCHQDVHLGQVGTACETCHSVQVAKFGLAGFSHTRTRFALTGAHQKVDCVQCHKQETGAFPARTGTAVRLTDVATECRGCHADVHAGQLGNACQTCHTTTAFTVRNYKHQGRAWAVYFVGRHASAPCQACHKPAAARTGRPAVTAVLNFKIDARCTACHADPHRGALGANCGDCHRP